MSKMAFKFYEIDPKISLVYKVNVKKFDAAETNITLYSDTVC